MRGDSFVPPPKSVSTAPAAIEKIVVAPAAVSFNPAHPKAGSSLDSKAAKAPVVPFTSTVVGPVVKAACASCSTMNTVTGEANEIWRCSSCGKRNKSNSTTVGKNDVSQRGVCSCCESSWQHYQSLPCVIKVLCPCALLLCVALDLVVILGGESSADSSGSICDGCFPTRSPDPME